jgi:hypothetical protein
VNQLVQSTNQRAATTRTRDKPNWLKIADGHIKPIGFIIPVVFNHVVSN